MDSRYEIAIECWLTRKLMREYGLSMSVIDPFFRQLEFTLGKMARRSSIAMLAQNSYLPFAFTPIIIQKYDPFDASFPHKTREYLNPTMLIYFPTLLSSAGIKYATHSIYNNVCGD